MVPNLAKNGRSFRGAGKYYLHDKDDHAPKELKPRTDDRVAWTDTRNCMNSDPDRAIDEMWATAEQQRQLKMQAGLSLAGRQCTNPVKSMSLAWHPKDEVTPEQMIAAADSFLAHMGWHEHQAVYVGHNDTAHPHMHIILNRIHPETGMLLNDRRDRPRAQEWALAYEQERGHIWCEKRLETANDNVKQPVHEPQEKPAPTNEATNTVPSPQPEAPRFFENLPHEVVIAARPGEQRLMSDEQRRLALDVLERDMLKAEQRAERQAWFKDGAQLFKATRHAVYDEVRSEYRGEWRDFYADKKAMEADAEAASQSALARAFYFAKSGDWEQARGAFGDRNSVHDAVAKDLAERKADIRDRQMKETRARQDAAIEALRAERNGDYAHLLEHQQQQRATMREAHDHGQRAAGMLGQTWAAKTANQNLAPDAPQPTAANSNDGPQQDATARTGTDPVAVFGDAGAKPAISVTNDLANWMSGDRSTQVPLDVPFDVPPPVQDEIAPVRSAADLGAGAIGVTANYIADQIGEFVAPTPPEVREAQAKAEAKREAEKPIVEQKDQDPLAKYIEAAVRETDAAYEKKRERDYWDDRERERDR